MILCLVFSYLLGGSLATNDSTEMSGSSDFSKSIMCGLRLDLASSGKGVDIDPATIPCECEVLIYTDFMIDENSTMYGDEAYIKSMVDSNKPVIILVDRMYAYGDWIGILTKDGNATDANVLCEFALKSNISGYLIRDITSRRGEEPFDEKVGKFIIPYLKQLKCSPDFIIGVGVQVFPPFVKNPCMYNFAEMNDLVTFYEIQSAYLNECYPKRYNGLTPLSKSEHGVNYLVGMEEVAEFLKESKICLTKLTYEIEVNPVDISSDNSFFTYSEVCTGKLNVSASCIQTTKNLYDKGKFVSEQNSGVSILYIDTDDFINDCGCEPFIALKNIVAGVKGREPIACEKFDIQSGNFKYK